MFPIRCIPARRIFALALLLAAISLAGYPVKAAWYEASSDHFVIYADDDEDEIRIFAENLERYHSAMERFTGRDLPKPSPSNRITVYAVGSAGKVRQLAGSTGVVGFYLPRSSGSVAYVQDIRNKEGLADLSTKVLLHEYAHHFLSYTDRFAMPLWMNEGAAEFFSAAFFAPDGSVYLGVPSSFRDFTIFWKEEEMTSVRELLDLDWDRLKGRNAKDKQSFYGRSWILYHYLSTAEDRSGQLREYWLQVLRGTPSLEAAQATFGDLGVLERQLNRHFRDRNKKSYHIKADEIDASPVAMRALSDGEAAMMHIRISADRGLPTQATIGLAEQARNIASSYPENPAVQAVLAKVEYDARNNDAAVSAAKNTLALDPDRGDALLHKGLALFRKARGASDAVRKSSAYDEGMASLEQLGSKEPDHTVPLSHAYRYFVEQGLDPTDEAKLALVRSAELAPFDQELWLITGMMHMNDGRIADAKAALLPLASNPHGGEKAEQVRSLLSFLSDKSEGQAIPVQDAISSYFNSE
ncbi:hypothetical protein [Erythrobacter sp. THAF29]|uniref:tetratricopeptide repeat protein n=1 Tax=Erythrobacter sp. THAF29 TaxID=2587851 RepID=UPI001268DA26|nr:hypothetical protein [Erythrobacter sp. THAF29]QFT77140.1 hypothetical protein FIU90_06265 [Erythrobacter sp. THAF29]